MGSDTGNASRLGRAAPKTKIEWTDATWNPVIGCTPVSPGCLNCYAATMANRLQANPQTPEYHRRTVGCNEVGRCAECGNTGAVEIDGVDQTCPNRKTIRIAEVRNGRAVFTGDVRTLADRLLEPLKWRKPRRVFVCSMSDLFHERVPVEFINRVFGMMAMCPQHTFQVLTKRPQRMAEYLAANNRSACVADAVRVLRLAGHGNPIDDPTTRMKMGGYNLRTWPLANVWLGTSVEDRDRLKRIEALAECPAAVRFISFEPLLEDLGDIRPWLRMLVKAAGGDPRRVWPIVGGESGPGARPCNVEWNRGVVRQAKDAGMPVFVKQLGRMPVARGAALSKWAEEQGWHLPHEGQDAIDNDGPQSNGAELTPRLSDSKGGDPAEWPEDLRVREMPEATS